MELDDSQRAFLQWMLVERLAFEAKAIQVYESLAGKGIFRNLCFSLIMFNSMLEGRFGEIYQKDTRVHLHIWFRSSTNSSSRHS
jgi:hypothetical protein